MIVDVRSRTRLKLRKGVLRGTVAPALPGFPFSSPLTGPRMTRPTAAAALPSTPDPTYGTAAMSSSPCTVPSSP